MHTKSIVSEGIQISYLEFNPEAHTTLFFLHGNSCTSEMWEGQYQSKLFSKYRLVIFDLPGHGKSEMFTDGTFSLIAIGKIMAQTVLKLSNKKPFVLIGFSLGTNLISEMLYEEIQPKGIILGGPSMIGKDCPLDKIAIPDTHVYVLFTDDASSDDVNQFVKETSINANQTTYENIISCYNSTAKNVRTLLGESITNGQYRDEITILKKTEIPALIIFGADDRFIRTEYLDHMQIPLWKNKIHKLAAASHMVNIDQQVQFNHTILEYLNDIFK